LEIHDLLIDAFTFVHHDIPLALAIEVDVHHALGGVSEIDIAYVVDLLTCISLSGVSGVIGALCSSDLVGIGHWVYILYYLFCILLLCWLVAAAAAAVGIEGLDELVGTCCCPGCSRKPCRQCLQLSIKYCTWRLLRSACLEVLGDVLEVEASFKVFA
jgi:hypothetical protein